MQQHICYILLRYLISNDFNKYVAKIFSSISSPFNFYQTLLITSVLNIIWKIYDHFTLYVYIWGFPSGLTVKNLPAMQNAQEMQDQEGSLGEGMATHSSILDRQVGYSP